jgi:hypothetical protein
VPPTGTWGSDGDSGINRVLHRDPGSNGPSGPPPAPQSGKFAPALSALLAAHCPPHLAINRLITYALGISE